MAEAVAAPDVEMKHADADKPAETASTSTTTAAATDAVTAAPTPSSKPAVSGKKSDSPSPKSVFNTAQANLWASLLNEVDANGEPHFNLNKFPSEVSGTQELQVPFATARDVEGEKCSPVAPMVDRSGNVTNESLAAICNAAPARCVYDIPSGHRSATDLRAGKRVLCQDSHGNWSHAAILGLLKDGKIKVAYEGFGTGYIDLIDKNSWAGRIKAPIREYRDTVWWRVICNSIYWTTASHAWCTPSAKLTALTVLMVGGTYKRGLLPRLPMDCWYFILNCIPRHELRQGGCEPEEEQVALVTYVAILREASARIGAAVVAGRI